MFGLDPLSLSTFLILAGNTVTCPSHEPTKINIIPRTEKVKYDYSQTLKQIQSYSIDTVDPYGFHGTTVTQGFMKGEIKLSQKMKFGQIVNSAVGYACVWYQDITIELHIDPTIVIAKELYDDPCMRNAILGHELKHVKVDRQVVNKYAKTMGQALLKGLKSRGFEAGPMAIHDVQKVTGKMQKVVGQLLELEYQKMAIERQERQREVDSLEEYESVDDKCPAFETKKKEIYADLLR
ncbi:MAG: hypothetical protein GC137_06835 [Alphaproteobacteria bacterium]|nr:hypothetical protein [Alphaproteobacteria bacterium]